MYCRSPSTQTNITNTLLYNTFMILYRHSRRYMSMSMSAAVWRFLYSIYILFYLVHNNCCCR